MLNDLADTLGKEKSTYLKCACVSSLNHITPQNLSGNLVLRSLSPRINRNSEIPARPSVLDAPSRMILQSLSLLPGESGSLLCCCLLSVASWFFINFFFFCTDQVDIAYRNGDFGRGIALVMNMLREVGSQKKSISFTLSA